jgi:hypothetical protein
MMFKKHSFLLLILSKILLFLQKNKIYEFPCRIKVHQRPRVDKSRR